jgi:hypothetical protein
MSAHARLRNARWIGPALISNSEASKLMEPRERSLDDPTVPAEPLA